jgi:hypothetical protein
VRRVFAAFVCALLACTMLGSSASASEQSYVDYHRWTDFHDGKAEGVDERGGLTINHPIATIEHTEPGLHTTRRYDTAQWTSPVQRSKVAATELVSSWNADTPADTWLDVRMRAVTTGGASGGWYTMGRWAYGDQDIQRTSVDGQSDKVGSISTDTFVAKPGVRIGGYQLQVRLYRAAGTNASPRVSMLGAMTSAVPDRFTVPASRPGPASGHELKVPRYAQNLHKGDFPEYGGGGENWCSPTSTEMVVEYWGKHPSRVDMAYIPSGTTDPSVDYAARYTYDYAYEGTGNWPFNTAYAARYGLNGHITRLNSLTDLEHYIARGIPVITSQSFEASELDGANYGTSGHLMVVVGFTKSGDVIVNDPATSSDASVRNVYKRRQFENVWLRTKRHTADGKVASGSGGVAYIITPRES